MHAERLQAHQVHVDLAGADLATARHGDARGAEASDERPEHRDAGTHLGHQFVRGLAPGHSRRVHDERMAVAHDVRAQAVEHLAHDLDVGDERNVMDDRLALPQQGGGHELERRVLGSRHGHFPPERAVALHDDDLFSHGSVLHARALRPGLARLRLPRHHGGASVSSPSIIGSTAPCPAPLHNERRTPGEGRGRKRGGGAGCRSSPVGAARQREGLRCAKLT